MKINIMWCNHICATLSDAQCWGHTWLCDQNILQRNRNQLSLPPGWEIVDLMADFQLSRDKDVNVDHKENWEKINMLGEKSHIAISSEMECQGSQVGKMYEKIVNQTMVKVGACPHTWLVLLFWQTVSLKIQAAVEIQMKNITEKCIVIFREASTCQNGWIFRKTPSMNHQDCWPWLSGIC